MPDNVEEYPDTGASQTLSEAELRAHWMPFTGNRQFKRQPRLFSSAEGVYYTTVDGRKVLMVCPDCGHAGWATVAGNF